MKCTINQKTKILEQIEDLLLFSNAPTKESIESEIRQSGESEFTFSGFLSNLSEEEITNLTDIIESLGVSSSDFFTKNNIIITRNVSAVIPELTNHGDVLSIFHNQPHLSVQFTNWVIPRFANATFIGDKDSDSFVKFDTEVSRNMNQLKEDSFSEIVKFLKNTKVNGKFLLPSNKEYKLFGTNNSVNYQDYMAVMKIAGNYFMNPDNFAQTPSYIEGRSFPLMGLSTNKGIIEAYFSTILLNNFDFVLNQLGTGVTVDMKFIGTFNFHEDSQNNPKYSRKAQGLHMDYWSAETHESEGSETKEDDLTKMLVASIPSYRKDGKTIDGMMEVKQLYLLGSRIAKFELENYSYLKNKFPEWRPFNQNSSKSLDFYIDLVTNEDNKNDRLLKLFEIKETLLSLKNFFEANNINKKEKNSTMSLKSIITQVINNNRGGVYSIYDSNGNLQIKEMTNFDAQVTAFNSWAFNKISDNIKDLYDVSKKNSEGKNIVEELFSEDDNASIDSLSSSTRKAITSFLKTRFSSGLGTEAFDIMLKDMANFRKNQSIKFESVGDLKEALVSLTHDAFLSYDDIVEARGDGPRVLDESVSEYMQKINSNPLFIAYRTGWLENYVVKAQMNITTLTGEKIPTFKVANLTYKDLELFEVHKLNEKPESSFRSLLIDGDPQDLEQEGPLLGTQTKLEAVSPDKSRNKSAAKFNVTENFKSNFFFDFLRQLSIKEANRVPSFGIQLGNYSDKSTILLKTIRADFNYNNTKVISMSDSDLKELIRSQGFNFYNDAVNTVISDYHKIFLTLKNNIENVTISDDFITKLSKINLNSSSDSVIEAFEAIDGVLLDIHNAGRSIYDINSLYVKLSGNSPLMEELHYSKYSNRPLSTNRQLLTTYTIFSSKNNFNIFSKRVEDSFINDYAELISNSNKIELPEIIADELSSLTKADKLNVSLKDFKSGNTLKIASKSNELNPLIKKWLWLNTLYRNEYLFLSAKGEFMHPNKNGAVYSEKIDLKNKEFWDNYDLDTSGRMTSMAKRNVLFTATIETPVRNSKLGVPDKINHAVIRDFTDVLTNVSGMVNKKQDVHDGSSYIDYVYSKLFDNSYPGKGYENTKKPFGTFITPNGVTIKKDAESVINNWNIMASNNSPIKFKDKKKQMLGVNIGNVSLNKAFNLALKLDDFHYKLGKDIIKIENIRIFNNSSGELFYNVDTRNLTTNTRVKGDVKKFNNLYQLWEDFGAEYSTDSAGNFNEGSNELLFRIVTSVQDNADNYFLKDKIIHIVSNSSAVKAGAIGVNPTNSWHNAEPLSYSTHESRFLGPQLDASHEADQARIKEVTQVISALAQNRDTAHLAEEAYNDIARSIQAAAEKYSLYINNWAGNPESKKDLYKFLAKKFVKDIQNTKGDTVAKILTQSLSNIEELPFSNQNFFIGFVRSIITDLNNNFISRYYSGTGAVLIPSHGIIKLYDVPIKNELGETTGYRQVMHNDIVREALQSNVEGSNNEEKISNYLNQLLPDEDVSVDKIQFGDTVEILEEIEDYDPMEHALIADDITIEEDTKAWRNDPTKINKIYKFSFINKPKEIFELVKDFEDNQYSIHFKTSGKDSLTEIEKQRLIGNIHSFLPPGARISTWSDKKNNITKGGISGLKRFLKEGMVESGETRTNWFEGKEIQLPVYKFPTITVPKPLTLNNPKDYYKFKEEYKGQIVKKINAVPRDLKPSTFEWKTLITGISQTQTAFDLDSVRLRLQSAYNIVSEEDKLFLEALQLKFNNLDIDRILSNWTQRNFQLLEQGKILKSIDELKVGFTNNGVVDYTKLVDSLFGKDNLLKNFEDVKSHYNSNVISKNIWDYKFEAAEMILGDIYKSTFDIDDNISMAEIKARGSEYFKEKLLSKFNSSTWEKDIPKFKLILKDNQELYINFAENSITDDINTINLENKQNELDPLETIYFIRGDNGEEIFTIPEELINKVKVKRIDGKLNLFLKSYKSDSKEGLILQPNFRKDINNLLLSNKYDISLMIPSTNNKTINLKTRSVNKDGEVVHNNFNLQNYIFDLSQNVLDSNFKSLEEFIEDKSKKMYASWEKSHEFVAARIPSQSMQSFMPMKNVAYFNTKSNEAYVSVWQIWFQGSDFDIDKAYLLGSGINSSGLFDTNKVFNYNNVEELSVIEKMPLPSGNEIYIDKKGLDLTKEFEQFRKYSYGRLSNLEYLSLMKEILVNLKGTGGAVTIKNFNPEFTTEWENFIKILNDYSTDKTYLKSRHIIKNSVVSKVKQIISSPSNQILATTPVDSPLNRWKKAVETIPNTFKISPYNMLGMFKQQYEASVGKDDVGISANGLKVFFALSSYFNNYYNNNFKAKDLNLSDKTFIKKFTINGKSYKIGSISDISISDSQKKKLGEILQLEDGDFRNSDAAMFLSGFTSAATDNAKELLMAKVNASVELASMHIYLMILGFTPEEIVDIMTSNVAQKVIEELQDDIFKKDTTNIVPIIVGRLLEKDPDNEDLKAFSAIYEGAQEIKILAKLLGANQKTSANILEVNKFLGIFENAVFQREFIVFGKDIIKLKTNVATTNEVEKENLNVVSYNQTLSEFADKIIEKSNGRYTEGDKKKIELLLKTASNVEVDYIDSSGKVKKRRVSILGGEFDYRYYIHPTNGLYRQITKDYYNLIKDSFNIFDVIESVPHFKELIRSIIRSHQLLSLSSVKYSSAFNLLKDLSRKYGHKLKNDDNPSVKFIMGNSAFPIRITDNNINGILLYIDSRLKESWLKSSKFGRNVNFSVETIKKYMEIAGVKTFNVYIDDEAIKQANIHGNYYARQINLDKESTVEEDFEINLNTMYGIANFKNFMEKVLLGIISKGESSDLSELLKVGINNNLYGLRGTSIIPSFKITDKHIPANADKVFKLNQIFNELDLKTNPNMQLPSGMNWRHLFYIYNLLVNNEKYGDKRITPLLEEYMKEPTSAASDYMNYSYLLDSGELDIFDIDKSLVNPFNSNNTEKSEEQIIKEAEELKAIDVLLYSYGKKGQVKYGNQMVASLNPDFVLLYGMTAEEAVKKDNSQMSILRNLLSKNDFLIQFKCD